MPSMLLQRAPGSKNIVLCVRPKAVRHKVPQGNTLVAVRPVLMTRQRRIRVTIDILLQPRAMEVNTM